MDIGATLRDAREERGLSLATVSAKTKIRIDQLRAIEGNAFERLPGGVFVRGFIRAYAREVGLDPEAVVAHYQAGSINQPAYEAAAHPAAESGAAVVPPAPSWFGEGAPAGVSARRWLIGAVVLVPVMLYILALPLVRRPAAQPSPSPVGAATPPRDVTPPTPTPPAPVATSGKSLRIAIRVGRRCWVSAAADGQRVVYRIMQPGETATMDVGSELVLRLGDAGALSFSVDGTAGRPLGRSGQPVTVRITRDNYREFLATAR